MPSEFIDAGVFSIRNGQVHDPKGEVINDLKEYLDALDQDVIEQLIDSVDDEEGTDLTEQPSEEPSDA